MAPAEWGRRYAPRPSRPNAGLWKLRGRRSASATPATNATSATAAIAIVRDSFHHGGRPDGEPGGLDPDGGGESEPSSPGTYPPQPGSSVATSLPSHV